MKKILIVLIAVAISRDVQSQQPVTELDQSNRCPTTEMQLLMEAGELLVYPADAVNTNILQVGQFEVMAAGVFTNNAATVVTNAMKVVFDYFNFFLASQAGSKLRLEQTLAVSSGTNWGGFGAGQYLWSKSPLGTNTVEYYLVQSTEYVYRVVAEYPATPTITTKSP